MGKKLFTVLIILSVIVYFIYYTSKFNLLTYNSSTLLFLEVFLIIPIGIIMELTGTGYIIKFFRGYGLQNILKINEEIDRTNFHKLFRVPSVKLIKPKDTNNIERLYLVVVGVILIIAPLITVWRLVTVWRIVIH